MNLRNTLAMSAAVALLAGPALAEDSSPSFEFNLGAAERRFRIGIGAHRGHQHYFL